jgi:isopenicillin N synthase-like dioxygenase
MSTLNFCNSWPSGADEFRNSSTRLLAGMSRIAHAAAGELAVALGVPGGGSDVVASLEAGLASSVMRVFHYHSADHCSRARREECAGARTRTGSSPHTDWHAITVIAEDLRVERSDWWRTWMQGLQFRPRGNSRWHRVHTEEGEVVVIFGDLLALASAGRVYSPVHRVVLGARARTSYTYFAYPRSGDTIADWARILAHSDHRGGGAAAVDVDTLFAAARAAASTVPWNTLMAGAGAISAYEPFERILLRKWRGVST